MHRDIVFESSARVLASAVNLLLGPRTRAPPTLFLPSLLPPGAPSQPRAGRPDKAANESEKEFIEDINCPLRPRRLAGGPRIDRRETRLGGGSISSPTTSSSSVRLFVHSFARSRWREGKKMNRALYWFSSLSGPWNHLLRYCEGRGEATAADTPL